jgi:hypothetical protein
MQRLARFFTKTNPASHNFRFLVMGAGRGGTSLLHSCLSAHPRLDLAYEHAMEDLLGYGIEHKDFSRIYEERTRRFLEKCYSEAEKSRPKLWGNKITTEQLFGLEDHFVMNPPYADMAEMFFEQTLPDIPVAFIIRDGRACVASKVKRTGQPLILATFRWRYSVRVYRYLRERRPNSLTLRFEDLLRAPEQELRRVCEFLGVNFEEEMLKRTQNQSMPVEYRQSTFDQSKALPPETSEELLEYLREDLIYCGYL